MLYRGFYACSKIWEEYPEIHFLCKKIECLLSQHNAICYLCLDGRTPKGRRLLGESYKANRHTNCERSVYEALPIFVHLLNNERIKIYYNQNYESDEIIFTLSRTLQDGRKKIISGDKDILQALTKDVVIDNGSNFTITEESYKLEYSDKFFGIAPDKLPIFRAIIGDPSDTLYPPVARFPKKLAAKLINEFNYKNVFPTIEELNLTKDSLSESEKKWVDKLVISYDKFSVNYDIMKLNVITDSLNNEYSLSQVNISEFLKNKILRLNLL